MASDDFRHTVAGGWLGTYYYQDTRRLPGRFEATFRNLPGEGRFDGTILDDGYLGEANVTHGVQQGTFLRFVKVYQSGTPQDGVFPVAYHGTLSEDGKRITGTWELMELPSPEGKRRKTRGTWDARRAWSEEAETETRVESLGDVLVGV